MVLLYLPTKLGVSNGANVGKYSSTMEHMGYTHCTHYNTQKMVGLYPTSTFSRYLGPGR